MESAKRILDLGTLRGPLLVFGGVYSNLQALEALLAEADRLQIPSTNLICTGDVVAYCAQPEECVQLIRKAGVQCIAGNVELQLAAGESDCACDFVSGGRCDTFSKEWYPYAQQTLSEDALAWMLRLPEFIRFQYAGKSFFVLHGSYHNTSEFIFRSTDWALKARNFEATQAEVILAGHCGLPFSEEQEGRHWLNAGVIGMPANDGTPRVWYLLLEEGEAGWTYTHRELHYDYQQARQGMIDHALPPTYAETLRTGIWDNCEILPSAETALQGQAIEFREMI